MLTTHKIIPSKSHTDLISHINCSAWLKSKHFDNTWSQQFQTPSTKHSHAASKKYYLSTFISCLLFQKMFVVLFLLWLLSLSHTYQNDTLNGAQKNNEKTEMFVYARKKKPEKLSSKNNNGPNDILPLKSKSSVKISSMRLKPKTFQVTCVCLLCTICWCIHQEMVRFFSEKSAIDICAHSVVWSGALFVWLPPQIKVHSVSDHLFE